MENIRKTSNPHLNIILNHEKLILDEIFRLKIKLKKDKLKLLDIGGGRGWGKILYQRNDIDYYALDLNTKRNNEKNITFIQGDITDQNLKLDHTFDIIFTKDTFEHILNPWDSTKNIITYLIDKGLFIFMAPFSWRYHASPYDTYRYTHTGVQYLFERLGKIKKKLSGYVIFTPNKGFWKNMKDATLDNKNFKECQEVLYIGIKDESYTFNINSLDSDMSINHDE